MKRTVPLLLIVGLLAGPLPAAGQVVAPAPADSSRAPAGTPEEARPGYPELSPAREALLSAMGVGLLGWGALSEVDPPAVPSGGLDPAGIDWGVDRRIIGNADRSADDVSNWTRNGAMALPFVVMVATLDDEAGLREVAARSVIYAEAMAVSVGATLVGKTTWRRPRPFTYLSDAERPDAPRYRVDESRAFRSMPSGHSSAAWTGASLAMTEHMLTRPDAEIWERVGVGFVGGALASTTGALRVSAGQHFPSDVLVGAGLGIATGVTLPLLHRGGVPIPPPLAWLETFGGALGGTLLSVWVVN